MAVLKVRDIEGIVTREVGLGTGLKSGDRTTAGRGSADEDDDDFTMFLDIVENTSWLMVAVVVVVSVVGVAAVAMLDTTQSGGGDLVKAVVETGS